MNHEEVANASFSYYSDALPSPKEGDDGGGCYCPRGGITREANPTLRSSPLRKGGARLSIQSATLTLPRGGWGVKIPLHPGSSSRALEMGQWILEMMRPQKKGFLLAR